MRERVVKGLWRLTKLPDSISHPMGHVVRVSRIRLANMVGCSREMAGRVVCDLHDDRVISAHGYWILLYRWRLRGDGRESPRSPRLPAADADQPRSPKPAGSQNLAPDRRLFRRSAFEAAKKGGGVILRRPFVFKAIEGFGFTAFADCRSGARSSACRTCCSLRESPGRPPEFRLRSFRWPRFADDPGPD